MSKKKECTTDGCKSPEQKDGLCYRCFKAKHGRPPYPSMGGGKKGKPMKKNKAKKKTASAGKQQETSIVEEAVMEIKRALKSQIEEEVRPMIDGMKEQIRDIEEWFAS